MREIDIGIRVSVRANVSIDTDFAVGVELVIRVVDIVLTENDRLIAGLIVVMRGRMRTNILVAVITVLAVLTETSTISCQWLLIDVNILIEIVVLQVIVDGFVVRHRLLLCLLLVMIQCELLAVVLRLLRLSGIIMSKLVFIFMLSSLLMLDFKLVADL